MAAYTNTTMLADTSDVAGFMGLNVAGGFTETMQDLVGVYTEAFLVNLIKFDAVTNWLTMNAIYKLMLSEYVARSIAMAGIMFDPNAFTDGIEAENMVTVHWSRMLQIQELLENADVQAFMGI